MKISKLIFFPLSVHIIIYNLKFYNYNLVIFQVKPLNFSIDICYKHCFVILGLTFRNLSSRSIVLNLK